MLLCARSPAHPLCCYNSQIDLQSPADPGVDFSPAHGTQNVCWSMKGVYGRTYLLVSACMIAFASSSVSLDWNS
jgi:hypothetical protein